MRPVLLRLKCLLAFSVTALLILCLGSDFSHNSFLTSPSPSLQVQVKLALDITADFRSLFSWNTKQIFVFVAAEYVTPRNSVNQILLWDRIVTTKEQARFHFQALNEYNFLDQASNQIMLEIPFNLTAYWNILPITGFLVYDKKVIGAIHKEHGHVTLHQC